MTGALRTVWPWKETVTTRIDSSGDIVPVIQRAVLPSNVGEIAISLVLLAVGACVVVLLSRMNPEEEKAAS